MSVKPREDEEEVVELLTWDPELDGEEEEEEFEDELPADEAMFAEGAEQPEGDDFAAKKPAELPQPDRARSHPDLPRVKSTAFKRLIR